MKKTFLIALLSLTVVSLASASRSWAGQVVTDSEKDWAHQAIAQEKTIGAEPSGNTVAVLYFRNKSGSGNLDPLSKGFAYMLMTDLAKTGTLQVVERVKLQALVEELGLGTSGIVDTGTSPRVGRLLQARYLVGGDILKGKTSDLAIDSDVIAVPKASAIGNPKAEGMLDTLFDVEKKILFQIITILDIKVSPEKREELKKPMSTSTAALLSLFSAMDCSDRKDYQCAEAFYKKALENDPNLVPAAKGLEELKTLGLASAKKKSRAMASDLQKTTSDTSTLIPDITELRDGNPGDLDKKRSRAGSVNIGW
jgi:TolB-like protein